MLSAFSTIKSYKVMAEKREIGVAGREKGPSGSEPGAQGTGPLPQGNSPSGRGTSDPQGSPDNKRCVDHCYQGGKREKIRL